MQITADHTKCRGIGLCEATAPSLFSVGDDGLVEVLKPNPSGAERDQAASAVSVCPTLALTIEGC